MKEPSWSTYIQHFGLIGGSSHRAKMYAYLFGLTLKLMIVSTMWIMMFPYFFVHCFECKDSEKLGV